MRTVEKQTGEAVGYLSVKDGILMIAADGRALRHAPLEGAGALRAGKHALFCADEHGTIWRLNRETLLPEAVFSAGPGVCDLCLSADETRLYALLADANSVVLLDSQTGRPLLLNGCGCDPRQILLHRGMLAAAGGESGCVHL